MTIKPPGLIAQRIVDYRDLIARSTADFVGREWVYAAIDQFLSDEGPRYFLVLGKPGSGKTALMARLVETRGYIHHFIGVGSRIDVAGSADWQNPVRFA